MAETVPWCVRELVAAEIEAEHLRRELSVLNERLFTSSRRVEKAQSDVSQWQEGLRRQAWDEHPDKPLALVVRNDVGAVDWPATREAINADRTRISVA